MGQAAKEHHPMQVQGATMAVKDQNFVRNKGSALEVIGSTGLWGSGRLHLQSRVSLPLEFQEDTLGAKGHYFMGVKKVFIVNKSVGVQGAAFVDQGQYPTGGPGVWSGGQGTPLYGGQEGFHWRLLVYKSVQVQGAAYIVIVTVKDLSGFPWGYLDSHRSANLCGPREMHWQSRKVLQESRGLPGKRLMFMLLPGPKIY